MSNARSCWRSPTATWRAPSRARMLLDPSAFAAWRSRDECRRAGLRRRRARFLDGLARGLRDDAEQRCWVRHDRQRPASAEVRPATRQATPTGHPDGRDQALLARSKPRRAALGSDFGFHGGLAPCRVAKYDKAVACLAKDRDVLLAFYDFPAEHWKHIRTTNPIESTFATVRLAGPPRPSGCLSRMTALTMVFKLWPVGQQEVAPPEWLAPHRRDHSRCQIQGRRKANRTRRLKPASPTFDNSSATPRSNLCRASSPSTLPSGHGR